MRLVSNIDWIGNPFAYQIDENPFGFLASSTASIDEIESSVWFFGFLFRFNIKANNVSLVAVDAGQI